MYIRTEDKILDMKNTNKCIYVIRDIKESGEFRYVSYLWDNWRNYFLIDYQNCILFSYNSAQNLISDLIKENLEYQNLVIELSPYYKDCKQSSNLAELCDRFVFIDKKHQGGKYRYQVYTRLFEKKNLPKYIQNGTEIYGAIWTDAGLKYIAKLDDKGEFELI